MLKYQVITFGFAVMVDRFSSFGVAFFIIISESFMNSCYIYYQIFVVEDQVGKARGHCYVKSLLMTRVLRRKLKTKGGEVQIVEVYLRH